MSQSTSQPVSSKATPVSHELNRSRSFEGDSAPIEEVLDTYTELPPEEQRGRPVLSYQIPQLIGETVLTSLPVFPLYRYHRDMETTTAWRVEGTAKAIIGYDGGNREDGPWFMLPPIGETALDLRWLMIQSVHRDFPFEIDYLLESTVRSILKSTRPAHREGVEKLLNSAKTGISPSDHQ